MPNTVSIYEPRTMMGVVKKLPPVRTFFRDTFFSNIRTFATKAVDVDYKKGNRRMAPFVSPIIGGEIVPNQGYETMTYKPPMIAPEMVTTVDDILDRQAGEALYSSRTPAQRAVIKMRDDFRDMDDMIVRREEWMCAQVMLEGRVICIGKGVNDVLDFNFTNKVDISNDAKKNWKNGTSKDIYGDLVAWHEKVQKNGFTNCNICVVASDVAKAMVEDKGMKDLLDTKNYNLAVINPRQLPNGLTYVGTINELGLDIYKYNEWYMDDWTNPAAPVDKPMMPDGTLMMASTHARFSRYYGAITVLNQRTQKFETVEGDKVPDTYIKKHPDRRFLSLASAPIPVPHEVDSWMTAKVL